MEKKKSFEVNVMMFGGRRSGKTSVLAAMKYCVDNVFKDSSELGLTISIPDFDTVTALEEKNKEIRKYYEREKKDISFVPDDNPTLEVTNYKFVVQLINRPLAKLIINFWDYPGEMLTNKDGYEKIGDMMKKSDIIMITIDTPYLMEECRGSEGVGKYNEPKNYSERIADLVKNNFAVIGKNDRKKMLLFVPLKCERYYNVENANKDAMDQLNAKVKKAYEKLITYVSCQENKDKYECAITPIFTMGNVRFSRFDTDENCEYRINEGEDYPCYPLYRFDDKNLVEPRPMFCEQPLLYTLVFLLKWAEQSKKRRGFIPKLFVDTLAELFLNAPNVEDFIERSEFIREKLKKEENGYEILTDPLKFKG